LAFRVIRAVLEVEAGIVLLQDLLFLKELITQLLSAAAVAFIPMALIQYLAQ
jgi:hypothetical protein